MTAMYMSGRSKSWLKTKAFVEGEFVVIGHKRDNSRPVSLLARLGIVLFALRQPKHDRAAFLVVGGFNMFVAAGAVYVGV